MKLLAARLMLILAGLALAGCAAAPAPAQPGWRAATDCPPVYNGCFAD